MVYNFCFTCFQFVCFLSRKCNKNKLSYWLLLIASNRTPVKYLYNKRYSAQDGWLDRHDDLPAKTFSNSKKKQNIYIWNMNKLKQMISEQYCSFGLCGGGGGVSRLVWPVITAVLLFLMRNVILV